MTVLRRTPCIGVCSTTYGDLVCRGCKRFAHEVVQWNSFNATQQQTVWERLFELRAGALSHLAEIADTQRLLLQAQRLGISLEQRIELIAFEVLRRAAAGGPDLRELGISPRQTALNPAELYTSIEQEIYRRSLARYEHSFHIPAQ